MNIFKALAVKDIDAATQAIPLIDVGPALRAEPGAMDTVSLEIRRACESVGFFYLAGHGVPQSVIDDAFAASREFHAMPLETKRALKINENNIGYLAVNESMQRHSTIHKATRPNFNESFFISHDRGADHPDIVAGTPLRGKNQWPEDHERMRAAMVTYFKTLERLGERLLLILAHALGMPADYTSCRSSGTRRTSTCASSTTRRRSRTTTSSSARARTPTTRSSRCWRARRCRVWRCGSRTVNGWRRR
jgi:isopenicillin N synthase-like dioxygenase